MVKREHLITPAEMWANKANQALKGKVISHIEYQSVVQEEYGWSLSAPIIVFIDGTCLIPTADEEMNEAGSFYFHHDNQGQIIPSI